MQDLRLAFRAIRATPIVSAVAILSLALGIGANTATLSLINSLMLRALPVERPDRLAPLVPNVPGFSSWTNPLWEPIRARRHELFQTAFAFRSTRFNMARGGQTDFVEGLWASGDYFDALGVPPMLGRTFTTEDDRRGGAAGHRTADSRPGKRPRSVFQLVAADHGAPEGRPDVSVGGAGAARRAAADPRGNHPARRSPGERSTLSRGAVRAAARRSRHVGDARPLPPADVGDHGGGRARAADRLREHRQSAPRARGGTAARVQRTRGAGRVTLAARPTTAR